MHNNVWGSVLSKFSHDQLLTPESFKLGVCQQGHLNNSLSSHHNNCCVTKKKISVWRDRYSHGTTSEDTLTLWHGMCVFVCACSHCRGNCSASLRRLLRLSAPSWLRMPGSISVSCLVSPWPVMAKVLADRDAWTLGLLKWITVPSSFIIFTWEKEGNSTVWIRAFILQHSALSGLLTPAQVY